MCRAQPVPSSRQKAARKFRSTQRFGLTEIDESLLSQSTSQALANPVITLAVDQSNEHFDR